MKLSIRVVSFIMSVSMLLSAYPGMVSAEPADSIINPLVSEDFKIPEDAAVIYVSPKGNDKARGTISAPVKTMDAARRLAATKTSASDTYVLFRGGTYYCTETVNFSASDSGSNGNIIYMAYPGEVPVFNGGVKVTNWEPYRDGIFKAKIDDVEDFREFYVNGDRQVRARTKEIQAFGFDENKEALRVLTDDLPKKFAHPEDLCTVNSYNWRKYYLPVEDVVKVGPYTRLVYRKPYITNYFYKFNFEWGAGSFVFVENAIELLDEAGEWYYDKREKVLYYKPAVGVDLKTAEAYAPKIEKFIAIKGASQSEMVKNLVFKGLVFQYSGWIRPNTEGYASVQATSMVGDAGAYAEMTPGHIELDYAKNITFENNLIHHTAANAIHMMDGVEDITINANIFHDIGASAVDVGQTGHTANHINIVPKRVNTTNNIIRNPGVSHWGAPAVTYYYTQDCKIINNDIQNCPYTGISVGWGWSKDVKTQWNNFIGYNKIFNFNTKVVDGAAIYTLSNNPGSGYVGNYVKGVNAPFNTAALYHDEQSIGFDDYDNVVEAENPSFLFYNLNNVDDVKIHDTYTNTGNMANYLGENKNIQIYNIHIIEDGNWPQKAKDIMAAAGLTAENKWLYDALDSLYMTPLARKPLTRTIYAKYLEGKFFEPEYVAMIDPEDAAAPYKEENGNIVMDAIDFNCDYVGLGQSNAALVGALGNENWIGQYMSRGALFYNGSYIQREKSLYTKNPSVGYKMQINTPGEYYIFVRATGAAGEDKLKVYWNGEDIGNLAMGNSGFSFRNLSHGVPMKVTVTEPGIYKLNLEAITSVNLDRIWLTTNPPEDLTDGSAIRGPLCSERVSDKAEYLVIPDKLTTDERPAEVGKRTNIALKKPSTASSSFSGYSPARGNNGSMGDDWFTNGAGSNQWWQVDLQDSYNITEICITFRMTADQAETRRNFEILASNDPLFETYDLIYNSGGKQIGFATELKIPVETTEYYRYVRVRKTTPSEMFGIAECKVYSESFEPLRAVEKPKTNSLKKGAYSLESAFDGNEKTSWVDNLNDKYWFELKLPELTTINKVQLKMRTDADLPITRSDFEIWVSEFEDFSDYTVLGKQGSTAADFGKSWTVMVGDPNKYQYVRFIKNGGYVGLSEFEVFTKSGDLEPLDLPDPEPEGENILAEVDKNRIYTTNAPFVLGTKDNLNDGDLTNRTVFASNNNIKAVAFSLDKPKAINFLRVHLNLHDGQGGSTWDWREVKVVLSNKLIPANNLKMISDNASGTDAQKFGEGSVVVYEHKGDPDSEIIEKGVVNIPVNDLIKKNKYKYIIIYGGTMPLGLAELEAYSIQ